MSIERLFVDGVEAIILIVLVIGIFNFKSLSKEIRVIFYFVLIGGVTELFTDFFKIYFSKNTMPVGHFYLGVSIFTMSLFYRKVLTNYVNKWFVDIPIIVFAILSIVNPFFLQSIWVYANYTGAFGALMLVFFSILFFSKIMTEAKIDNLLKDFLVLLNIAILFYYAGNFFYFILFNLNVEFSNDFAKQVHRYYCVLNGAFYIFIGIIFYKSRRLKKQ